MLTNVGEISPTSIVNALVLGYRVRVQRGRKKMKCWWLECSYKCMKYARVQL